MAVIGTSAASAYIISQQPMFERVRSLLRAPEAQAPAARLPPGQRVYAIGDIHGRLDLFAALADAIEAEAAAARGVESTVILLGDLVDRGPDSASVIAGARVWQQHRPLRILLGNHEEMFLKSFESIDVLRHFLRHGGRETLMSYGVSREDYAAASIEEVQRLLRARVPEEDVEFVSGFEDMIAIGDYLFVRLGRSWCTATPSRRHRWWPPTGSGSTPAPMPADG